jgi:hypothetical protein
VVKSLNINEIERECSLKLSENMIAFPFYSEDNEYGWAILLVDYIKREKIKIFEIKKVIPKYDFKVMTLIDEKTMLLGYSDRNMDEHVLQYNIVNDDLELIDETETIKISAYTKIVKLSGGRLITTDHFDGVIFVHN